MTAVLSAWLVLNGLVVVASLLRARRVDRRAAAWEQHCDQALAVARADYTDEALALADLALWEMEMPT